MKSTPNSRKDFERNINILNESFLKNRVNLNSSMHRTIRGIQKGKALPNNRVNLISINEQSRLLSNSVANFSMIKDYKNEDDHSNEST